jgi:hypothetical protein
MTGRALAACLPAAGLWAVLPDAWPILLTALLVPGTYAGTYLAAAYLSGSETLDAWIGRLRNR